MGNSFTFFEAEGFGEPDDSAGGGMGFGEPDDSTGGGMGLGWEIHPGRTGATLR
ncbi:MAG: hypothetical protein HFH34_14655 [Eubacterium sp.]|nr:hypothetical protein [Eubacterium sp.]